MFCVVGLYRHNSGSHYAEFYPLKCMEFILPLSPSVNAMYRHRGHITYKTAEAKEWIEKCKTKIKTRKTLKGKVDVRIEVFMSRESDLDNRIKAILDVMQECKVIENDRQVYSLLVNKHFDKLNPRVEVEIRENDI